MTIDPRFVVSLKGREYVLYAGLLDAATRAGLRSIEVTLLQIPTAANGEMALATATAIFADERRFTEIGDASPASCAAGMLPSLCRLAGTRAKARVLRDALSVAACSVEELPPQDHEREESHRPRAPAAPVNGNGRGAHPPQCEGCGAPLREAQRVYSVQTWGRGLCLDCRPVRK